MKYQENNQGKCRSYLDLDLSSSEQEIRDHTLRPLCPKPRRSSFHIPFACNLHSQQNGDDRSVILNRLTDKGVEESRRCMSSWYAGSPPRRTGNPLVHDVQFLNTPFTPTKLNF